MTKESFDHDGFLKVPQLIGADRMPEILRELARYESEIVPYLAAGDLVYESAGEPRQIRNLWRMEKYSQFFADLGTSPDFLKLFGTLVNGKAVLMAVELFAKPALVGSAVPYHQDNGYFNLTPPDALTCWIAIDPTTIENGCVYYATGTHRSGLWPHKATHVPGNSWGLASPPEPGSLPEVAGILSPGDAMIHHCCLLHRSEPNRSEHSRRGLLLVYRAEHCRTDEEGMRAYQAASRAVNAS